MSSQMFTAAIDLIQLISAQNAPFLLAATFSCFQLPSKSLFILVLFSGVFGTRLHYTELLFF
jgi:hypothetical protein